MSKSNVLSITPSKAITLTKAEDFITREQFDLAGEALKSGITNNEANVKIMCVYIMQAANYRDQQAAIKALGKIYMAIKLSLEGKAIEAKAASQWIRRKCKEIDATFKPLVSQSEAAQKKAKTRAARAAKAKDDAEPKGMLAKPKAEKETTLSQIRTGFVEKAITMQNDFRGMIPAGKVQEFDATFAAFINTMKVILA